MSDRFILALLLGLGLAACGRVSETPSGDGDGGDGDGDTDGGTGGLSDTGGSGSGGDEPSTGGTGGMGGNSVNPTIEITVLNDSEETVYLLVEGRRCLPFEVLVCDDVDPFGECVRKNSVDPEADPCDPLDEECAEDVYGTFVELAPGSSHVLIEQLEDDSFSPYYENSFEARFGLGDEAQFASCEGGTCVGMPAGISGELCSSIESNVVRVHEPTMGEVEYPLTVEVDVSDLLPN